MRHFILHVLILCTVGLCAISCRTEKSMAYFKNADSLKTSIKNVDYALKLVPADQIQITISSMVPEATDIFRFAPSSYASPDMAQTKSQNSVEESYIVDSDGCIEIPVIGKLKVAGLSTLELKDLILKKVSEHVENPVVKVTLTNFRVNILGEVRAPGAKTVKTQKYTILDAIADAGDITLYGKRENVMLIREEDGVRTFHRLNIEDAGIVNSPYFYLKQNDVIYVEPNAVRVANSEYNQNNSFKISVVSTVVSAISVIASLIVTLVVANKN